MTDIILNHLNKSFNKKQILSDINLEIKNNAFTVLLGASGCGKSTLLRIIAGLEKQDSGDIIIDGKNVNKIEPKDRNIAFVFQTYALYPHLSVYDNIAFPLKIKGIKNIKEKVLKTAQMLGLDEYLKHKPKELSGGQRQRVALGRAIIREAKIYLLDEPLSNLDAKLRADMRIELKKLHSKLNAVFIYVTHDQTEALTMGDEIVILNEGKIIQKDTPDNIFKKPINTFAALFSGTYPMNLINVTINNNKVFLGNFGFDIPDSFKNVLSDRNKAIMGIRPENIKLKGEDEDICIEFSINFTENTGGIKILHLDSDFCKMKAVVNSNDILPQKTNFYINKNDIIFFDYFTKKVL